MSRFYDLRVENGVWKIEETRFLHSEPAYLVLEIPVDFFDRESPRCGGMPKNTRLYAEHRSNVLHGYDDFGTRFNVVPKWDEAVIVREEKIRKPRGRYVWYDGQWGKWNNGEFVPHAG